MVRRSNQHQQVRILLALEEWHINPAFVLIVLGSHDSAHYNAGVKNKNAKRFSSGPSCFMVQGSVCHYIGLMEPEANEKLGFLQLYIYDGQNEVCNRANSRRIKLDEQIVSDLQEELHACNPHVQMFKAAQLDTANCEAHVVLGSPTGVLKR